MIRIQSSKPLPGTVRDPLYPDSDGKFMGETDHHANAIILLREAFTDFLADRPEAYVASQLVLYYHQGNPSGRRDPDVLVALNVGKHVRRSFRVWEERAMPEVLFEICSESTWQEDVGPKRDLYQRLGIREYFLFDPEGRWLNPVLQGFRLVNSTYVPIAPGPGGSLTSLALGVQLVVQGPLLRVIDARTGVLAPTRLERAEQAEARAQEAEKAAKEARDRADELAAELARLRAQLRQDNPPAS